MLLPATLFSKEIKPKTNNTPTTTQVILKNYTSLQIGSLHQQDNNTPKKTNRITISGTITDDTRLPLPGATNQVKNSKQKTTSDFDGNYKLVVKKNSILEISYTGYESFKITVIKKNIMQN